MRALNMSCLWLIMLLVHGCSSGEAPPPPPAKTVFDPMTRQIDRAREVQKTVDQNADETRKAADAEERGAPNP